MLADSDAPLMESDAAGGWEGGPPCCQNPSDDSAAGRGPIVALYARSGIEGWSNAVGLRCARLPAC